MTAAIVIDADRHEPLSPFVRWSGTDRTPLPDPSDTAGSSSLIVDVLRDPEAMVGRLLKVELHASAVLGSMACIILCTAFFAFAVVSAHPAASPARAAVTLPFSVLLALAAAFGPIYAAGALVAARVPMSRLVATMLSAVATGSLILATTAPVPYALWKLDPEWAGPASVVAALAVSAVVSGVRLHRLLFLVAQAVASSPLTQEDTFRVGIVARMATVFLAFTIAMAMWAFNGLG